MYLSEDIIEEVRSRNDIVDVISSYVKLQKKGSSYFGLCPFHNEKSPSFSVSGHKQMFYCFGCGEGGNVFSFIMKYENFTFPEAVKLLADRVGMELPELEYSPEEKRQTDIKNQLYDVNREAARYFHFALTTQQGTLGLNYLKKRELTDETIKNFGLGYSSQKKDELYMYMKSKGYSDELLKDTGLFIFDERGVYDRFRNRVMYPILNVHNKVIGFGGRVIGEGEPKYLNSPETKLFDKSRNLFGLNAARTSRKSNMIICEGYMDVISMHQAGFTQAVASLGTALTAGHAMLLKRYTNNVLICYDSDGPGTKAAIRAIGILREAGLNTKVINMKPYKDPDEFIKALGQEAFQERIDNAGNSFMFELSVLENGYDLKDPDGKTAFLNEVAKKLTDFEDEIQRNNYIDAVANKYFVSPDVMKKQVAKYAGQEGLVRSQPTVTERVRDKKNPEDGILKSQRILLTWLVEQENLYSRISKYISPEDFTDDLYREVATLLFEQLSEGKVNPAKIISHFEDEEAHATVARLFNTEINGELDIREKERAINETLKRIKKYSLDLKSAKVADIAQLQAIIKEQAELETLHISLD